MVRITGEGEPGPNGTDHGDLYVVVRVAEHEYFSRKGNDLVLSLPISFAQAALGATVNVPTLDGEEELSIPRGSQHGDHCRIHDHGFPSLKGGRRGDMIAILSIDVPKNLTERQDELLREFAETEHENVSAARHSFWDKIKESLS